MEWEAFLPWLEDEFTIFTFADFYHGESEFPHDRLESSPLQKDEIAAFFRAFANEKEHSYLNLMAYSSGGRTVLCLIEKKAFAIDEVWLFAPDGIEISLWNKVFGNFKWAQKVFKKIISKPDSFFKLARSLNKAGLLSTSLTYFVLANMREEQKRQMIYNYWLVYREVIPDVNKLINIINEKELRFHLIFGEDDRVISPAIGKRFIKGLESNSDLTVLKSGHLLVDKKHLSTLIDGFPLK